MKKIAKIASLIFVCVMLFATLAMSVYAEETAENTELNDIFQFVEYSLSENGEPTFGFTLNLAAKEAYENQIGKSVDIGIVIATLESLNGNSPIGADGKPIEVENNNIYVKSLNGLENTSYSFKLVNFAGDIAACKYVVAPYVYDGANTYYYQNGEISETVTGISFDEITKMFHEHTEQTVEATAPTCTATGLTEGKVCAECGEVLVEQTEIPALGHIDENGDFKCDRDSKVVEPEADSVLTIEQAIALGNLFASNTYSNNKYYITGMITEVYNTQYGNMYITDGKNEFTVYGLYSSDGKTRYDAMTDKPVAFDEITIYGSVGRYNTSPQVKNACLDELVKHEHTYTIAATCTTPEACICGLTNEGTELGHTTDNGTCERCGKEIGAYGPFEVEFTLGANGTASHSDGSEKSSYTETVGDYKLSITLTKGYTGARDAMGNSAIKLGTGSVAGGISFTVPNDVTEVIIYVAKYKTNSTAVNINGTSHTLTKASNNGEYDAITIDTTSTKEITLTVTTGKRAMVNTIVFKGDTTPACAHETTSTVTNASTCTVAGSVVVTCDDCGAEVSNTPLELAPHNYASVVTAPTCLDDGYTTFTCTACGNSYEEAGEEALGHNFVGGECDREGCDVKDDHKCEYTSEITTAATCTTDGVMTYTCESCGDSYEEAIKAIGHADENNDYKCDNNGCTEIITPEADSVLTIEQALALGKLTTTTDKYYVTGIIKSVYNTSYGNMYLTTADKSVEICIYGTYSADGSTRYDKLTVKPVVGDTITVYGILTAYNGAGQMKDGWITEHTAHECVYTDVVTDPTCISKGYTTHTCNLCGKQVVDTEVEALGHTTENGVCENCGNTIGGDAPVLVDKTYSYTFTAKQYSANGTKTLGDVNWTLAGTYTGNGFWGTDSNGKGHQFGSKNAPYTSMTLTSESFSNVKKIVINTSGGSGINATLNVTVGGVSVGSPIKLTTTATEYTIEIPEGASGEIVFSYTTTTAKAIYIKSISVEYAEEA